ncbi:hypothetical protein XOC_1857 [Xanthomonas oryzae pv. oryzicola BLS256]|uniref:Uncharacterized protein n=1 Tax=Xanthomonas oryzae pv. oryzicola (strain BLS256) TaxID=383407 RepID=G7TAQ4_XANOB|nr:hypothetical protein XOC_1857 [Xanthomonas oryzae pv. oryzicola BLS256]QEO98052.1 hypothetical protein XOCgx_3063 [Xanthomonas oryzae pv. oryzicola]
MRSGLAAAVGCHGRSGHCWTGSEGNAGSESRQRHTALCALAQTEGSAVGGGSAHVARWAGAGRGPPSRKGSWA